MTDRTIIGQKIAELRKEKGLTQAELADQLGVTHQAVSQWERSETLPDILTLPKIAEIFGESLNSLLGMETEGPSFPEDKAEDPDRDKAPAAGEEVPGEEGKPQETTIMEDEGVHDTADEPEPTVEDAGDSYRIQLPPITIPGIPAIELPLINIPKAGGAGNPNSDIADRLRESQEKAQRQAEAIREEARRSAEAAKKQAEAIRAEAMHSAEEARKQAEAVREDMLLTQAMVIAADAGKVSTSLIQRKLSIGYGQAARIIDRMEELGYIAPQNGLGPREVLLKPEDLAAAPDGDLGDFYKEMSFRAEAHKAEFERIAEKYEKEHAAEIEASAKKFEEEHAAEIEEWTKQYEKEHADEIEESARKFEEEHAAEIEEWTKQFEKEHAADTAPLSNDERIQLGGLDGYSLPVSEESFDFGGAEGSYEIVFVRDGKIIANFIGDPNARVNLIVNGVGGSLKSELNVTVNGDVCGPATSGLGMTVNGDVNGDAHAGLELTCWDVAGNAEAGLGLNCGDITGSATAGMGIQCASAGGDGTRIADGDTELEFSADGKTVTIHGDYEGDLTGALSVTVEGDVNGEVTLPNGGTLTVGGDVNGDMKTSGGAVVGGDVYGDASSGGNLTVGGDVSGNASSGGAMSVNGDVSGDAAAKNGDLTVGGDVGGDASCSGNLEVSGDIAGDVTATNASWGGGSADFRLEGKNVIVEGNYDGDLSAADNVTVEGDVNGGVEAGGSVTVGNSVIGNVDAGSSVSIEGQVTGDVDAGGRVNIGGNLYGNIDTGGNVQIDGDANGTIEASRVSVKGDYRQQEE